MGLVSLNLESIYLHKNTNVSILLPYCPREGITPEEFYDSGKKYKVLWLLHGFYGDNTDWIRKSMVEYYAAKKDLIVVMPDGMNSFYLNLEQMNYMHVKDYILEELMPMIFNWFPASAKPEDNYIAGLSMGGLGVLNLVLSAPERFNRAAVLSYAPIDFKDPQEVAANERMMINYRASYPDMESLLASKDNVFDYIKTLHDEDVKLPELYFSIGKQDGMYQRYLRFKKYLTDSGIEAEFSETDGYAHDWDFWDIEIRKFIERI
jgi:putative tributyrin esterase